ncbi:hypothetical protein MSAN_01637000 [Mycena sanguinolenta]|uniref:BTB domain-containing protein n=1 Tax=Mycena sanguinolenta TaxID=230812 RepID=A0A8H6Y1M5_9AGAR|nr:hypothetical protein MSAN_01637000 [Mycena sanguinolenta]
MAATPVSRTSERFCAPDADLTVSSCDGVLFKVHRKHLEAHSDVFADAANATLPENGNETVYLEESSDVLDLLFQCMYRQPPPDLQLVEFPLFMRLAEAVEKYAVYSALTLIGIGMKKHIIKHPLEVLDFAEKHGRKEFGNQAARMTVGLAILDVATILSLDTFKKWMAFHDKWHAGATNALANLVSKINEYNYEELSSTLEKCVHDPKLWYDERSTLTHYTALAFLDIEFM